MPKTLRTWLCGIVSLVVMSTCGTLQAQSTYPPLYFCGAVGEIDLLLRSEGLLEYTFLTGGRPTIASFNAAVAAAPNCVPVTTPALDLTTATIATVVQLAAPAAPAFYPATLDYLDGQTTGTGEMYIIIFSTAELREAFLYYLAQRDASATYEDYLAADALVSYSFWMGQENESLALYTYYTTLGDYYYVTNVEASPNHAAYYYWYYRGLGAYYYYERQGNLAAAEAAFAYHLGLANASL